MLWSDADARRFSSTTTVSRRFLVLCSASPSSVCRCRRLPPNNRITASCSLDSTQALSHLSLPLTDQIENFFQEFVVVESNWNSTECAFWNGKTCRQEDFSAAVVDAASASAFTDRCDKIWALKLQCVSKKDTTQPPTIISTVVVRSQYFLVQIFLSKYAIERWFDIPHHLFIVRTLPWETLRS